MATATSSFSRRQFLQSNGCGFGMMALAGMLQQGGFANENPLAAQNHHFPPRVRNVIFLFMRGGPSQVDTLIINLN